MTYYKWLNKDGSSFNGGKGKWKLPRGSKPGTWMPAIKNLVPCKSGYHVCTPEQLVHWIGPALYECEVRGALVVEGNKTVVESARLIRRIKEWDDRTERLFACDCAAHILPIFEKKYPKDKRTREAIAVARRYANGKATKEELAAARAAARDAAWAAARAAASDAVWAAARDAASDGARDGAWKRQGVLLTRLLTVEHRRKAHG
jgi:hypothetical protein